MAFYRDDEQDESNGTGAATTGATSGVIDAGTAGGASNGPQQAQAQAQASSPSPDKTNFVGISKYLDANKTQAAKLGDQTAGVINNSADQARSSVNDLNSAASSAIKPVASLGSDILGKLNSTPEALSDAEKAQIKNTESATYAGPQSATDLGAAYTNASQATKTAAENIDNSGTEQGRMNLISQINSAPRTQGINLFDNALVQTGDGRQKIADAATSNAGIKSGVTDATNAIQNQITGAKAQTSQSAQDSTAAVQQALAAWKSSLASKVAAAPGQLTTQANAIQSDFDNNPDSLDPATLKALGITPGTNLYNLNLNDYIKRFSPTDINTGNVASSDDYAKYAALADLAGDQSNYLDPANAANAGKLPSAFSFDQSKFNTDETGAQQKVAATYDQAAKALDSFGSFYSAPGQFAGIVNGMSPQQILDFKSPYQPGSREYDAIQAQKAQAAYKLNPNQQTLQAALTTGGNFAPQSMFNWYKTYGNNTTPGTSSGATYDALMKLLGTNGLTDQLNSYTPQRTLAQNVPQTAHVGIGRR